MDRAFVDDPDFYGTQSRKTAPDPKARDSVGFCISDYLHLFWQPALWLVLIPLLAASDYRSLDIFGQLF